MSADTYQGVAVEFVENMEGVPYEFANVESMADRIVLHLEEEPEQYATITRMDQTYVLLGRCPEFANPRKGRGRGAERDTVTSWSLPLEGTAAAKNMPPIETCGGSYDADRIPHFPTPGQYKQYSDRTETKDGRYECN